MKKSTSYSVLVPFVEGREYTRLDNCNRPNIIDQLSGQISVFYRLGCLYEISQNNPKKRKLIEELIREFSFSKSELPNYIEVTLNEHYSHKLIRNIMDHIGYIVPIRLNRYSFHACRVR